VGCSPKYLIDTIPERYERGVELKSLTENIDTTTSGGNLGLHIFGRWPILGGRSSMNVHRQGLWTPETAGEREETEGLR
jgi:hypothetical protein